MQSLLKDLWSLTISVHFSTPSSVGLLGLLRVIVVKEFVWHVSLCGK